MRQVFILAVFSVWMFACNDSPETRTDSVTGDTPIIDTVIPVSTDSTVAAPDSIPAEPTYPANFRITFTSAYCGGARPSEEILSDKATPKLLYTSTLKFKNHFSGKEYFLTTSPDGEATAAMEEGKYDVFLTKDINAGLGTGFDPKCNLWLDQLLLTVKVSTSGKMQDVNIHFVCNPCDETMKRRQ